MLDDSRARALRRMVSLIAVGLCAATLVWRVHVIANAPRFVLDSRVIQLMYNRMLAQRIQAYARTYGRPAYELDSMLAHLDSAETATVVALRTDLWGEQVYYWWSWCNFELTSSAGRGWRRLPHATADSLWRLNRAHGRDGLATDVRESYPWPPGVGRKDDCMGGP